MLADHVVEVVTSLDCDSEGFSAELEEDIVTEDDVTDPEDLIVEDPAGAVECMLTALEDDADMLAAVPVLPLLPLPEHLPPDDKVISTHFI